MLNAPLACSDDQAVALKAIQALMHRCFVRPLPAEELELAVGWSMLTPAPVRANLINREEDFRPELARLKRPVLVTYGAADTIVLPSMAKAVQEHCPNCRLSEYPNIGHAPFLEDPARFNRELAEFVRTTMIAPK